MITDLPPKTRPRFLEKSGAVVLAGQNVGVKEVQDRVWLVSFMDYELGFFDEESARLEPAMDPFGPKVLPMSSV